MPPKNKNKKFLAKQKAMQEEKKRKEEEEEEARKMAEKLSLSNGNGHDAATNGSRGKRPTAEELGFFIRTGPDAEHRTSLNMDIIVEGFTLTAGSLELISSGLLALNFGVGSSSSSSSSSSTIYVYMCVCVRTVILFGEIEFCLQSMLKELLPVPISFFLLLLFEQIDLLLISVPSSNATGQIWSGGSQWRWKVDATARNLA